MLVHKNHIGLLAKFEFSARKTNKGRLKMWYLRNIENLVWFFRSIKVDLECLTFFIDHGAFEFLGCKYCAVHKNTRVNMMIVYSHLSREFYDSTGEKREKDISKI